MSWREQLREASFRGVRFLTQSADDTLGRRTVVHEFPLRDEAQVEDLGARPNTFSLNAYVIGDDYMAQRDLLQEALMVAGPGPLVHPYYGEIYVSVVGEIRVSHSSREGGMATFTLSFVQSTTQIYPDSDSATQAVVETETAAAGDAAEGAFTEEFSNSGLPSFVTDEAAALVGQVIDRARSLIELGATAMDALTEAVDFVEDLSVDVAGLINAPGQLVDSIRNLMARVSIAIDRPRAAYEALAALFDFGSDVPAVPGTTPARLQQAANQAALVHLVRLTATLEAASVISRAAFGRTEAIRAGRTEPDFLSYDDAVRVRDQLVDQIDALAEAAPNDSDYYALAAVRAAVVQDISRRGANLARLTRIELPDTLPALALAYQLYGAAERDQEIIDRNGVVNPLLLPSGAPLEVLTDA